MALSAHFKETGQLHRQIEISGKLKLRVTTERCAPHNPHATVDVAEYQISVRDLEDWIVEHGRRV